MLDNGLNKYLEKHISSHGFLKLDDLGFEMQKGKGAFWGVHMVNTPEGQFCLRKSTDSRVFDSEILLGQVYNLCGVESAIYLPVVYKNRTGVISNNLDTPTSYTGFQFNEKMKDETGEMFPFLLPSKIDPKQMQTINKYFTKDAVRDIIKKVVLDVCSCNTDGHLSNVIYQTQDGKVCKIQSFDNEFSGKMFFSYGPDSEHTVFFNPFQGGLKRNREEIVDEIKNNETSLSFITPQEIAESIGSVDIINTAKDIEQNLPRNFFNMKYVDGMAYSFDKMAEDLVK